MIDLATAAADGDRFEARGLAAATRRARFTGLVATFAARCALLGVPAEAAPAAFEAPLGIEAAPAFGTPAFLAAAVLAALAALACCKASSAASAFFRACFAAFFRCLDNFRACLSWVLAARTCCFAACARAAAFSASKPNRCAATPFLACAAVAREFATICPVKP